MTRGPAETGPAPSGENFRDARRNTPRPDSSQGAPALPRLIASIQKNGRETIRVEISEFKGRPLIGLRVWWAAEDGGQHPSSKGLSTSIKNLPALARALADAERIAREAGLLKDSDGAR